MMPAGASGFSSRIRVYFGVVLAAGAAAIATSLQELAGQSLQSEWLVLAGLTVLTGSFSIKLPSISARISVSETFVFVAVLLYGPSVATLIVALDTIILTSWKRGARRSPLRTLINVSSGSTAIWLSAHTFQFLLPESSKAPGLDQLLIPVSVLAISYFVINSSLIAVAVASERSLSAFEVWQRNFAWISLNYVGGASVATMLVTYQRELNVTALSVIVPLLVITYLTFRTSLGRLEDAHRHVAQLNELYLSTIETLAMAVDAKDQITHGHIRRVQVYAVELAKHLGVSDSEQLKAIEAAALLHDMGKLAIPEHILNKPGKLTSAEFDKMKRHSDIGADLLSSVRFPYPVVPIVRHHHEQWDGKGYPSGISGVDIPLGARILSVVDCFDALNSDRPYRPRMSVDDSFKILRERRGTMYDPLVVDAFVAIYPKIAVAAESAGEQARSLTVRDEPVPISYSNSLLEIRSSAAEAGSLLEAGRRAAGGRDDEQTFAIVAQYVRQLTPSTACCYFRYSVESDALICVAASGEGASALVGFTIRRGERVTGWVGANQQTVSNADPMLDLGEAAQLLHEPPKSALSTPVIAKTDSPLAGVLTTFSPRPNAFSSGHVYAFEQLAGIFAENLRFNRKDSSRLLSFPHRLHGIQ
jgi:putative nucleotidyltransferase with HDIG domain